MIYNIIIVTNLIILWFFIILSFCYLVILAASVGDIIFRFKEATYGNINQLLKSIITPSVTALIPAYNEEANIFETVSSILSNNYPNTHVIVINDGSTDTTLELLKDHFDLYQVVPAIDKVISSASDPKEMYQSKTHKNLMVINKDNTGKSDSLNVGLNVCTTPLFITLDADTLLVEPDAVNNMVFALLSKPHTVAMGGAVYILNGCKFKAGKVIEKKMSYNPVSALQVCEYLRSFLFSRSGLNPFGGALCYSGAFTLFEKQVVEDIGGFDRDNVAQDFEIIAHLQAYRYDKHYPLHLGFTTSAVAWTDVPSTFKQLWIQRIHWQEGSIRSMFLHIKMLFNPKYRMIGLFTYPYYFFGELFGSLIEFLAYVLVFVNWYLGILNLRWAVLMILVSWGFVAFLTMANTLISLVTYNKYRRLRDVLWIFFMVFLEQFGLRQYLVICRVFATIKYFLGL